MVDQGEFIPVPAGDIVLAVEVDVPLDPGSHAAVIMVHGSGRGMRYDFAGAGARYASIGLAAVRFDKRGVGDSGGRFTDVGPENSAQVFDVLASDLVSIVDYLLGRTDIDPTRIGLLGVSQAGWIMPLAAARDPDIAFMISTSGAASSVGVSDYFDRIAESGGTKEEIAMLLDQFSGVHGFDPRTVLEQLAIPAVWVYGGRDTSNPTDRDIQILEEIRAQHGSDFTICLFPNADHGLNDVVNGGPAPASQECVDPWLTERFLQPR